MKFNFRANSLSKAQLLKALFYLVTFNYRSKFKQSSALFAEFLQVKERQLFWFAAGRMGLYSLIKSLKLTAEDEVIVPGYTCVVVSNAIKFSGCQIKYVDINIATLNLDTDLLLAAISPKTKMIIVAHNFGITYADIARVKLLHPEIIILEDAAHALGASLAGKRVGTLGDASFFSFEYSKPISCGLGGCLVINNRSLLPAVESYYAGLVYFDAKTIARIIISLAVFVLTAIKGSDFITRAFLFVLRRCKLLYGTTPAEINGIIPKDYPVKLAPACGVFLYDQIKQLDAISAQKNTIAADYFACLGQIAGIRHYYAPEYVFVRYPIVFNLALSDEVLGRMRQELTQQQFNFGVWFNDVVHPAGSYRYGYQAGSCPVGEAVAKHIINLPVNICSPLGKDELNQLKEILARHLDLI